MATGLMIEESLKAAEILEEKGISVSVINHSSLKPFDNEIVLSYNEKMPIVTVEEHSIIGGLGSAVADAIAGVNGYKFKKIGINDKFGKSGKPDDLFKAYGLTAENIVNPALSLL